MEATFSYPLDFQFKLVAFSPQFSVKDSQGRLIAYIKQKAFKFKEDVSVFSDESRTNLIFKIKADRWLDWSATYNFSDTEGNPLGKSKRRGSKSLFKAQYDLYDLQDNQDIILKEHNFWVRVMDGVVGELPIINMFTGYMFNPKYDATRPDGTLVAQLVKQPSMFGRKFSLVQHSEFEEGEELRILLGFMMLVLLERRRG